MWFPLRLSWSLLHTSICHGEQVPHPNGSPLPLSLAGHIVSGTSPLQHPGASPRSPTPISIALDHPLSQDLSFSILPGISNEESNLYTFDLKLGESLKSISEQKPLDLYI